MDIINLIAALANSVGLTPACILALVVIAIFYKLLAAKDKQVEVLAARQSKTMQDNTAVLTEIKVLFTTFLAGRN